MIKRVAVFCGAYSGTRSGYADTAWAIGAEIARRGLELVYGGGKLGLMGAVADGALSASGKVIGVILKALEDKEVAHRGLTQLHVVDTMHERKAMMADLSDAFVTLPGGFGTMDEFFEIITWAQLGYHRKAIGVLNVDGFYDPLITFFGHIQQEGFIRPEQRAIILTAQTVDQILDAVTTYEPPLMNKWVKHSDL